MTKEGRNAVKVDTFNGSANIVSCKILYGNGKWDTFTHYSENHKEGIPSEWLDLRRDKRCLEAIALIGKRSNNSYNRAMLKIYEQR